VPCFSRLFRYKIKIHKTLFIRNHTAKEKKRSQHQVRAHPGRPGSSPSGLLITIIVRGYEAVKILLDLSIDSRNRVDL
jgi:hypothetical protein